MDFGLNVKHIKDPFGRGNRLLKSGIADLMMDNGYVSHQFKLSDFEKGFDAHNKGDAIKVVLIPE